MTTPQHPSNESGFYLSLHEVSYSFGVNSATIIDIINEGIITTQTNANNELCFDHHALRRIRTVLHLNNDLGVNLAGAGLALDLLAEIERLQLLLHGR